MNTRERLAAWALAIVMCVGGLAWAGEPATMEGVVAIVNNEIITSTDLRAYASQFVKPREKVDREKLRVMLDELINNRLLMQAAKAEEITVSPDDIDAEVARLASRFPSEKDYVMYLIDELNITLRDQKKVIESRLMRNKLIEQVMRNETYVPPKEIRSYYEKHKTDFQQPERRHIHMISVDFAKYPDREAALKRITEVKKRLDAGENFAQVAKEVSDDPAAAKGGDYGLIDKGTTWILTEEAFKLAPGKVSDIIESRNGYHLVLVGEVFVGSQKSFDEVQAEVTMKLRKDHNDAVMEKYVKELRDQAYIKVMVE
jgi:parvulin-like peptidyl-prolyl isomerase